MAAALRRLPAQHRALGLCLLAALGALLIFAAGASADLITPESGGSPNADRIDSLYKFILAIAVVVFVGVEGVLIYSLFRYRAKKGRVAAQIHGNTNLEIGWTLGAALILVFITVFTFAELGAIQDPPKSGPGGYTANGDGALYASVDQPAPPGGKSLRVQVNGQQYIWRFTYPDGDGNPLNDPYSYGQMVVPADTTVTLDIQAQDVAHSWWIPKLGGKFDAIPGNYINHTWFKAPKAGVTYDGQCAELCGRNHADMRASVKVVTPAQFKVWLANQKKSIDAANRIVQQQRTANQIPGTGATPAQHGAPAGGGAGGANGPKGTPNNMTGPAG